MSKYKVKWVEFVKKDDEYKQFVKTHDPYKSYTSIYDDSYLRKIKSLSEKVIEAKKSKNEKIVKVIKDVIPVTLYNSHLFILPHGNIKGYYLEESK